MELKSRNSSVFSPFYEKTRLENITPQKVLHNKGANLEYIRVIETRAFVHIERYKKKLDPHAAEGSLFGYSSNTTCFRT